MLTLAKAVGVLLMPPGVVIVLALLGLALQLRWRRLGAALAWGSIVALLILSLPVTGYTLMNALERSVAPLAIASDKLPEHAGAIVVLGGGRIYDAAEYGGDTLNAPTLERVRYAARLQRASGLPLLVSGGSVFGEKIAEAELMQQALVADFKVNPAWIEARSRTTHENALYSRAILEAAGIRRVILVTHARHMPRAVWAFQHAGVDVIPAPTGYAGGTPPSVLLNLLPSERGLSLSSGALHEWFGLLWYRLAYRSAPAPSARALAVPDA